VRIKAVLWDQWNISHIAHHGVEQAEVEELLEGNPQIRKSRTGSYVLYGQSEAGRYLIVVIAPRSQGMVYVITARDMSDREKKWTKKRK
jgi:uncharacterized DUF497 family protein